MKRESHLLSGSDSEGECASDVHSRAYYQSYGYAKSREKKSGNYDVEKKRKVLNEEKEKRLFVVNIYASVWVRLTERKTSKSILISIQETMID
jgi:hypothetical protein